MPPEAGPPNMRETHEPRNPRFGGIDMKILIISILGALALGGGQALAASTSHQASTKTLKVVMRDPGCHWFLVHGKDVKAASVHGRVRVLNLDEAKLKVASRAKMQYIAVGKSLVLGRGHYVVMMVGQAADDNYLKLSVG
jgi:hypothetical protein